MKKRIRVLFTVFIMCLILATPTFAASSAPSVELMNIVLDGPSKTFNSFSPTLYFRNNSGKSVKYYDWYFTLYNRVGDPTPNEATNSSTVHLQVIGPISPDEPITTKSSATKIGKNGTNRYIYCNNRNCDIYTDYYGNYFIYQTGHYNSGRWYDDTDTLTYLTPEEAQTRSFYQSVKLDNAWYSGVYSYIRLQKVIVTYMDGTVETIDGSVAESPRINSTLTNNCFKDDVALYSAVYDYWDYRWYNSDLVALFDTNQYRYFQHFITSGMKEGRQAKKTFNLTAYKANNPDLVSQFGSDNTKYYLHYMSSGQTEGRKAT